MRCSLFGGHIYPSAHAFARNFALSCQKGASKMDLQIFCGLGFMLTPMPTLSRLWVRLDEMRKWENQEFSLLANVCFRCDVSYTNDVINEYRFVTKPVANKLELDALNYTIEYRSSICCFKKRI